MNDLVYWHGWLNIDNNILPVNDLRKHIESDKCWCAPIKEENLLVHHSLDGREDYETGKRKFS